MRFESDQPCKKCGGTERVTRKARPKGMGHCVKCRQESGRKSSSSEKRKETKRLWLQSPAGKKSAKKGQQRYNLKFDAKHRRYLHVFRDFGLTRQQYDAIEDAHKGICALCGKYMEAPCVDHDHETGRIRGLVHQKCNSAIGFLGDNPDGIKRALRYLTGQKADGIRVAGSEIFITTSGQAS